MHRSKEPERTSSPGGQYYSPQQMKNYLQDLRTNRPARPTGSRPPPAHFNTWSSRYGPRVSDQPSATPLQRTFSEPVDVEARPPTAPEPKTNASTSTMTIDEVVAGPGRALVQPPRGRDSSESSSSRERTPSVQYRESTRRIAEQDEARGIRVAMEELELAQEARLYESARDEAAELVYRHRNPDAPGVNPSAPYAYPGLAKKGSMQRSRSVEPKEHDQDLQRANSKVRKRRSMGSSASGSRSSSLQSNGGGDVSDVSLNGNTNTVRSTRKVSFETKDKLEQPTAISKAESDLPDMKHRRSSSGSRRRISGSLFRNPNDQIYEEPEEDAPPAPAPTPAASEPSKPEKLPLGVRRNPFMRFQSIKGNIMTRSNTDPTNGSRKFDRYEIQKNPPSQSRNAEYTLNPIIKRTSEDGKSDVENTEEVKMKDGKEIRSEEIRAATGFRLKDRSEKLPTPTLVSDSPGRPIVSFTANEIQMKEEKSSLPVAEPISAAKAALGIRPLSKSATAPVVPTLATSDVKPEPIAPVLSSESRVHSRSPFSNRMNRASKPAISIYEDPPAKQSEQTRKPPSNNFVPQNPKPVIPTISVSENPPMHSRPAPGPPVPTISVSATPSISVSGPSDRVYAREVPSIGISPPVPSISVSESPARDATHNSTVPAISITPDVPMIAISESPAPARPSTADPSSMSNRPPVPSISINNSTNSTRPLPNPKNHSFNGFGYKGPTASTQSRPHWTPTNVRTGALCTQCALPIAGRIVSAAGLRFHPECFMCYQCGEHLECVAFYPEPDNKHHERVQRIEARLHGEDIAFLPTHPTPADMAALEASDGTDTTPRFYCHLDYHELFSPRCKSCKTPIEGEVVVACGAEWHAGHFFCAQCGDPFDSSTPFVEKDGYAWCVNCHTHRYSTKCKKCRKPVVDTVVKALGTEWHVGCFCCVECEGPFEDGRYFLRGDSQDPVCVRCEERRLKA